jgi:selenide,water dikinase
MSAALQPIARDIVLVGGGHSHVGVLRRFAMKPEPGVRLTVICTDVHTPYSGMLPGYIAGHYSFDEVHIDLARLAAFAGARLYHDEVLGIDRAAHRVLCRQHPPVHYDRLSLNTGSTPALHGVPGASEHAVAVKPITGFNARWLALLSRVRQHRQGTLRVAVVGAGAGGVELTLAMQYRLRRELQAAGCSPDLLAFELLSASPQILPTHNPRVRRIFEQVLAARGVRVHLGAQVQRVEPGRLLCASGEEVAADEIVWVTQAAGAPWLPDTGLALDQSGFVRVNDTLQSVTDPHIFAAGDVAALPGGGREKAGVFAVRQGGPLADNLRLSLQGQPLRSYRAQSRWLALISTGDAYAVASRGALGFSGAWVWRWKDWIDRRFMRRFTELTPMAPAPPPAAAAATQLALREEESLQAISALAMRCGGCGAKVGAGVLSRALGRLQVLQRDDVLVGLNDPDDAAVLRVPPGRVLVHSVDFFRAFIDDPFVFGQIAANHALGDLFAMGAEPQSATAIVTVPPGLDAQVEELLFQLMSGAIEVLNAAGCALVGGHTGEGQELALGFAVNGLVDASLAGLTRKGGMRAGDVLILTKALGTGTLFAAHARLAARGRWIDGALQSMRRSNRQAADCLRSFGATACTDVTGFGLLGHLVEMTRPSGEDARIRLSALPLLEGAREMVAAGIMSSLQPANVRLRRALRNAQDFAADPRHALLFDPQTAGGLLASVPAARAQACLEALHRQGDLAAAIIGEVLPASDALAPIELAP